MGDALKNRQKENKAIINYGKTERLYKKRCVIVEVTDSLSSMLGMKQYLHCDSDVNIGYSFNQNFAMTILGD